MATASRASQLVNEALVRGETYGRASQLVNEALVRGETYARVSQLVLEVLLPFQGAFMPVTYPVLVGLGYSVFKRPLWSTGEGKAASGVSVRVGYYSVNLWEWDLTYEYLPDKAANGTTDSDYKTLTQFFLATAGRLTPFLFKDPDDNYVSSQFVGTGDGAITQFTLGRYFNGDNTSPYEPIGYLDNSQPFNVYFDGVLQDPGDYEVILTQPMSQQLKFTVAPAADVIITVDMGWYFYAIFKDDTMDFEKFMDQLWSMQKLTLQSVRRS